MEFPAAPVVVVLAAAVATSGVVALVFGSRGGRFRGLPGWAGFWVFFGLLLAVLSRVNPWISLALLGLVLFGSLKEYFFLAPLRPQDRWAILFAYLSIPAALYPVAVDSYGLFLTAILLCLFLALPTVLSLGSPQDGLLDSMGRVLLGLLVFVFCASHLAWMIHLRRGSLEMFGVLVLASELPQRLTGRMRLAEGLWRSLGGVVLSFLLAVGAGAWLAGLVGISSDRGMITGALVALSVVAGGLVTEAVARDLALGSAASRVGRAALLDRITPAVYAAPLFFHYLNHFA